MGRIAKRMLKMAAGMGESPRWSVTVAESGGVFLQPSIGYRQLWTARPRVSLTRPLSRRARVGVVTSPDADRGAW